MVSQAKPIIRQPPNRIPVEAALITLLRHTADKLLSSGIRDDGYCMLTEIVDCLIIDYPKKTEGEAIMIAEKGKEEKLQANTYRGKKSNAGSRRSQRTICERRQTSKKIRESRR